MTKELSHVMLEPHNVRIELSNVRKKSKGITKCDKRTITCDIGSAQCEDGVGKFRLRLIELTSFKPKLLIRFIMNKTC